MKKGIKNIKSKVTHCVVNIVFNGIAYKKINESRAIFRAKTLLNFRFSSKSLK
ncbi:hypothetical protein [Helicobacter cholecystus]|uniref:hypothetical protein n=1 Tax=Helicobacter cholecystus TaxID=45498 RepID=UPI002738D88E|nr:hypothetical protein [Helicobacter cholecystus]